ncbi:hypothetical protein Plhal304r1_c011g0041981 [Plasmopara halstedii]
MMTGIQLLSRDFHLVGASQGEARKRLLPRNREQEGHTGSSPYPNLPCAAQL